MHIYVSSDGYSHKKLVNEGKSDSLGNYVGSITVETDYTLAPKKAA